MRSVNLNFSKNRVYISEFINNIVTMEIEKHYSDPLSYREAHALEKADQLGIYYNGEQPFANLKNFIELITLRKECITMNIDSMNEQEIHKLFLEKFICKKLSVYCVRYYSSINQCENILKILLPKIIHGEIEELILENTIIYLSECELSKIQNLFAEWNLSWNKSYLNISITKK